METQSNVIKGVELSVGVWYVRYLSLGVKSWGGGTAAFVVGGSFFGSGVFILALSHAERICTA